ncbi:MAG TPA: HPr family phosphocarrier protein [Anaerolineales bacterium]|nr:HPr family phosphocarrier protein [Anaerolineales bacterium]
MIKTTIPVKHKVGLHARPASMFVQAANKFASEITVRNVNAGGEAVDAKSILMVLTLGVVQDNEIELCAQGDDELQAVQSLGDLVRNNFGEAE